jgi:hypothetical protein
MRALAGILALLLLGAARNVCAGCGIDSKARIIVWPQSNGMEIGMHIEFRPHKAGSLIGKCVR